MRGLKDGSSPAGSKGSSPVGVWERSPQKHRSRIRYLSKKIANFNEFSEIKKFVKICTKIR